MSALSSLSVSIVSYTMLRVVYVKLLTDLFEEDYNNNSLIAGHLIDFINAMQIEAEMFLDNFIYAGADEIEEFFKEFEHELFEGVYMEKGNNLSREKNLSAEKANELFYNAFMKWIRSLEFNNYITDRFEYILSKKLNSFKIKIGDKIDTPRFLSVKISEVFDSIEEANASGYTEPTHYESNKYDILGKHIEYNRMIFAAALK